MTNTVTGLRVLSPATFRRRLPELIGVYVEAMNYPPGIASARSGLWDEHSRREGFAAVVALDPTEQIRGLAYGYIGRPGQWWFSEVHRGLTVEQLMRRSETTWLADFFELTELHVRPDSQGAGLGQGLLTSLLADRQESAVLLSTPEGTNRAWRLYRRMGFVDVLRNYRFTGDPRPFAVLGRRLPLPPDNQPNDRQSGG